MYVEKKTLGQPGPRGTMSDPWLLPNAQTLGWCPERRGGGTPDSLIRRLKALPPNLMVDVGALDGSDAIAYAQAGHRVWSFEPTPSKLEPIRKRFAREAARGASIRLFPYALSNESGSAGFVVNRAVAAPRMRRFVGDALGSAQDGLHAPPCGGGRERAVVNVPVRTLDGLIPSGETVFMLKVDTQVRGKLGRPNCVARAICTSQRAGLSAAQGFDYRVLLGAAQLLAEHRISLVVTEFSPELMPGRAAEARALVQHLHRHGYKCAPCRKSQKEQVRAHSYAQLLLSRGQWDNLVCRHGGVDLGTHGYFTQSRDVLLVRAPR